MPASLVQQETPTPPTTERPDVLASQTHTGSIHTPPVNYSACPEACRGKGQRQRLAKLAQQVGWPLSCWGPQDRLLAGRSTKSSTTKTGKQRKKAGHLE